LRREASEKGNAKELTRSYPGLGTEQKGRAMPINYLRVNTVEYKLSGEKSCTRNRFVLYLQRWKISRELTAKANRLQEYLTTRVGRREKEAEGENGI